MRVSLEFLHACCVWWWLRGLSLLENDDDDLLLWRNHLLVVDLYDLQRPRKFMPNAGNVYMREKKKKEWGI